MGWTYSAGRYAQQVWHAYTMHHSVSLVPGGHACTHLHAVPPPPTLHLHTAVIHACMRGPATALPTAALTCTRWFLLHRCSSLPSVSNMKMHLSGPADRKRRLSGIQQQHVTASLCCVNARSSWPEALFHSRSLLSSLQGRWRTCSLASHAHWAFMLAAQSCCWPSKQAVRRLVGCGWHLIIIIMILHGRVP